jgi:ElaA protein
VKIQDRSFAKLTTQELHDIVRLRVDVFVVEQECPYPELDGRDTEPGTRHVWMADDVGVVAYLRVLDDDTETRIGRVVTRDESRSGGFAGALLDHVLETSEGPWVLDAQTYLVGWYRKRGFDDDGEEYVEDGIPHLPMRRELPAA